MQSSLCLLRIRRSSNYWIEKKITICHQFICNTKNVRFMTLQTAYKIITVALFPRSIESHSYEKFRFPKFEKWSGDNFFRWKKNFFFLLPTWSESHIYSVILLIESPSSIDTSWKSRNKCKTNVKICDSIIKEFWVMLWDVYV